MMSAGKLLRSLQSLSVRCLSSVSAMVRWMAVGTARSEVPVSTMAPQPFSQPTGISLTLETSVSEEGTNSRAMLSSATPQVMVPTTGSLVVPAAPSRVISFQTIHPGEPTFRPRQVEKVRMLKLSNRDFWLSASLSSSSACALTLRRSCGTSLCIVLSLASISSSCLMVSLAVRSGWPGGPTPTMDWKPADRSSGMRHCWANQMACLGVL
mmetsp:Transcript_36730/g.109690  ORF Transcript_36730/g.109690 Transcript_36730/m.109690 type:complete len:210 (-) Transcript_36730:505-1134(-)